MLSAPYRNSSMLLERILSVAIHDSRQRCPARETMIKQQSTTMANNTFIVIQHGFGGILGVLFSDLFSTF
jgi:hypothetical protein